MKHFALNISNEEEIIKEAIIAAREVQHWIWGADAFDQGVGQLRAWIKCFEKRINKIKQIDPHHPSSHVELRKRVLQQAALSVYFMSILDHEANMKLAAEGEEGNHLAKQQNINFIS